MKEIADQKARDHGLYVFSGPPPPSGPAPKPSGPTLPALTKRTEQMQFTFQNTGQPVPSLRLPPMGSADRQTRDTKMRRVRKWHWALLAWTGRLYYRSQQAQQFAYFSLRLRQFLRCDKDAVILHLENDKI